MYIQVEEVTLPFRFLLKTAHFIAVLAVAFDLDRVVSGITEIDPTKATGSALAEYNSSKRNLEGLVWASVAFFAIEYVTLFMGVTIFLRHITIFNILMHTAGLILTILFYADTWTIGAFAAFFVVFSALPLLLELFALFFVTKMAIFVKY